jgi:hypothetical protein
MMDVPSLIGERAPRQAAPGRAAIDLPAEIPRLALNRRAQ